MNPHSTCRHLRAKSMFIPALDASATPEEAGSDVSGSSPLCWCNCTLSPVGPDDRPVNPELCQNPRPCYEE